jgi:hypothetical protein
MPYTKEYPLKLWSNKVLRDYTNSLKDTFNNTENPYTYEEWLEREEITDAEVQARLASSFTVTETIETIEHRINNVGDYAMFRWDGANDVENGDIIEGQYLRFASSSGHGNTTGETGTIWKCVGFSQGTSNAPGADENRNRTTMYVRIK